MNQKIKSLALSLIVALLLLAGVWTLFGARNGSPSLVLAATQSTGGPDAFGYVFADSLTTPALYNWVDISGSGALVNFLDADTAATALDLPAPFAFYDRTYTKIYVTINGYASFKEIFGSDVIAQCNPAQREPSEALPALCADLRDGTVYYQATTAYNGHQSFVVQYNGVTHVATGASATFQIILDLESHAVVYQYHTVPAGSNDATAGIIGYAANRADYLTYCQGASCPAQAGLAVRFSPSRPRLDVAITPNDDFPETGDTLTYTVTLQNTGGGMADGAVMKNALPAGLEIVDGLLQATAGAPTYQSADRTVTWSGDLAAGAPVTLTYAAVLNTASVIYNTAVLSHPLAVESAGATSSPAQRWDDGEPLDAPHKFDYRLGSWRHIAVDSSGVRHIAYGGAALYYATQPALTGQVADNGGWTVTTVPGTVTDVRYAALILDAQERPVIAFYGDRRLWLARQAVTGWTVTEIAQIGSVSSNFKLDLAQGSDGTLHLVYNELGNASTNSLYYTRYDGAAWRAPVVAVAYPNCAVYSDGFSLAVDAANTPHVACIYKETTPRQLRLYTYAAAAPWSNFAVIAQGNDFFYYPSLAFDGATAHVAFYQGFRSLYHAQGSGATWQVSLVDESAPTNYLRQSAALAVNGGVIGIVGATRSGSYGDYTMRIDYAARGLAGGAWETQTVASLHYRYDDPRPMLAVDGAGKAHLAYYYSPDRTLRYAAANEPVRAAAFTSSVVDESRTLGSAAVALGDNGATHVVWQAENLYYAVRAAGAATWTKQLVAGNPGSPALALAVDDSGAPHLAYGQHNQPLVHAMLSGSVWVTRVVDLPGEALGFDIGVGGANNAHLVYVAVDGDNHVLRYAAFGGAGWSAPATLATLAPTAAYQEQTPKIAVQGGKLYVLYADCTGYQTPNTDYPIVLKLATWTAGSWSQRTLYTFAGRCDWRMSYALDGDGADQLAAIAHINSESVRPNPLVVTFRIEEAAGVQQIDYRELPGNVRSQPLAPADTGEEVHAAAMMPYYMVQSMLRGNWGWLSTWIENGTRQMQIGDGQGNQSRIIQEATGKSSTMVRDSQQKQGESVLVEVESKENKLRVPRIVIGGGAVVTPTLTLGGSAVLHDLCPHEALTSTVTVFTVTLTVDELADWEAATITFQGSGAGNEQTDIERVELYLGNQLLSSGVYGADDGQITLAIGRRIPAGTTITLRVVYRFKQPPITPWPVQTFDVTTQALWVNAHPVESPHHYESYVLLPPTPVSSSAHRIAAVRNTDTNEGFAAIQHAIDDNDTQGGHHIAVCPGTYREEVRVNKSWLTVYSTGGRDVTTMDGEFDLGKSEVTIKGFTITGSGNGVIAGRFGYNCTIADNTIRENDGDGIELIGGFQCRIYGNLITRNGENGIDIWRGLSHVIGGATEAERNIISANGKNGVDMYNSNTNSIQGNYIGAGPDGRTAWPNGGDGVHCSSSDSNLIGGEGQGEGNLISGNMGHGVSIEGDDNRVLGNIIGGAVDGGALHNVGSGVYLANITNNTQVHGNHIEGNLGWGVMGWGENSRITSNEIRLNKKGGISLNPGHGSTIRDNLVSGNDGPGLAARASGINVFNNRIGIDAAGLFDPNDGHGIHLFETSEARIAANIIRFNRGAGIYLNGVSKSDIWENRIGANAQYGVEVRSSSHINVTRNAISEHPQSGIYAWQSYLESITRNQIYDNCRGIHLVRSEVSVAHGNTIRSNTCNTGIHLDDSTADIAGNVIADDAYAAIFCENGASPTIRQNHITANQGGGVLSDSDAAPTVRDNNITGNSDYGVRNADPAVTLNARENWWGAANGPGGVGPGAGDAVSEYVDYGDWRTGPMNVVVIAERALVSVAVGSEGSNNIALNHFGILSDTLTLVITDTLGWLSGPTHFTVPLEADLGAGYAISITVPAGTPYGTISQVYVTAVSQHDPAAQGRDTFQVEALPPYRLYLPLVLRNAPTPAAAAFAP
ncbi:MAG: hypothetical protein AUK03_10355 [Anaerolineae bacterium CG2_30_64_16]|nr:MAG: hypothetical protein AUK03_10355 [Anaerolineae bacterium CG2_30_64_16]